jgi:hypothetical protein
MLEFGRRFLSFVQVLDGIVKAPRVQGSHPQGVKILSFPRWGAGATEFLLAQPQVDARSFRYPRYSAGCQLFEYLPGFFVILLLESARAELEIPDRRLKQSLRLSALNRLRISCLAYGAGY